MKKILRIIAILLLTAILLPICMVALYRYIPVPVTPLMLTRKMEESTPINYTWTPIEKISPNLVQAVVASEDNLFMQHNGFDFKQIEIARREAEAGKRLRGASTITQQTAKNLFTFCTSTWARKGIETYYTVLIEWIWPKERILEVYLNSIEMGPAIYGAEAVARQHFSKSASKLTRSECALVAATLPNPKRYSSKNPSSYMRRRQNTILRQMQLMGK